MDDGHEITQALHEAAKGSKEAEAKLFEAVYEDLRKLAVKECQAEREGHTLTPTALVHETYIRLFANASGFAVAQSRKYFFAAAGRAMKRILVDHARSKKAQKRGGGVVHVALDEALDCIRRENGVDVLELGEALDSLAEVHPEKAQVLEYRVFGDLTTEEIAEVLSISVATVTNHFEFARAFLKEHLSANE